jgi:hypothetical protein
MQHFLLDRNNFRNKGRRKKPMKFLLLAAASMAILARLPAQQPQQGVDLDATALHAHSSLRELNLPAGFTIDDQVRAGMPVAQARGSTGLTFVSSDHADTVTDYSALFKGLACTSELAIVGAVQDSRSHLNDYHTGIYSDYDIAVGTVLKSAANQHVIVAGRGGSLLINGFKASFEDETFPVLRPGKQYMLFLRILPTGAYIVVDRFSTLELDSAHWRFSRKRLHNLASPELDGDLPTLIKTASLACGQK